MICQNSLLPGSCARPRACEGTGRAASRGGVLGRAGAADGDEEAGEEADEKAGEEGAEEGAADIDPASAAARSEGPRAGEISRGEPALRGAEASAGAPREICSR